MWRQLKCRYAHVQDICSPEGSSEHKFAKRAYGFQSLDLSVRSYLGRVASDFLRVPSQGSSITQTPSFQPPEPPQTPQLPPPRSPPKEWLLFLRTIILWMTPSSLVRSMRTQTAEAAPGLKKESKLFLVLPLGQISGRHQRILDVDEGGDSIW